MRQRRVELYKTQDATDLQIERRTGLSNGLVVYHLAKMQRRNVRLKIGERPPVIISH